MKNQVVKVLFLSLIFISLFSCCKKENEDKQEQETEEVTTGILVVNATLNKNGTNIGTREGISVYLENKEHVSTNFTKYTDSNGKVTFEDLEPGFYILDAQYTDNSDNYQHYSTNTSPFEIKKNETRTIDLELTSW